MEKKNLGLESTFDTMGNLWGGMMSRLDDKLVEKLDIDPESVESKNLAKCFLAGSIYGFVDGIPIGVMAFGLVSVAKKLIGK